MIPSSISDIRCEVLVENVAVEVYGVDSKEKEQSGYIISEENKHFTIRVHDGRRNPTDSLTCRLDIDGVS